MVVCLGYGADQFAGGTASQPLSVTGGPGNDSITGGTGNDALNGGNGIDFIDGGPGSDVCRNVEIAVNCEVVQN